MPWRPIRAAPRAFVLAPSQPEFAALYAQIIAPALTEAGYVSQHADDLLGGHNVLQGTVRRIADADLVIAELTGLRPNVLYELGMAQGLGVPAVLLTQSLDEIPFDIRGYRVLVYSTRFDEIGELKNRLATIAAAHRRGELSFASPVTEFLPELERSSTATVARDSHALGPAEQARRQAEFHAALTAMGEALEEIFAAGRDLAEDLRGHIDGLERLEGAAGPGTSREQQRIFDMAASDVTRFARGYEDDLLRLEQAVDELASSGLAYLHEIDPESELGLAQLREHEALSRRLLDVVSQGLDSLPDVRQMFVKVGSTGNQDLDRALRRGARNAMRFRVALERLMAYCEKSTSFVADELAKADQSLRDTASTDSAHPADPFRARGQAD